jgi:hypothetical protein
LNDPYGYSQLTGFTLLNNGRAIMHGPNIINYEKQRNIIPIETFPFLKKEATSKEHIYRRLYGVIDLTGVEEADRNKSVFNWGVSGKDDISLIAQEIFKTMKEILNVMMNAENNPTIIKKISINKPSIIRKVDDIIHELPALDQFVTLERGGECSMNFGNTIIIFKIKHVTTDAKRALQVKTINHNEIVEIYLNDQHYLWRDLLNKNDASSAELKGKFIYPLAVAYAICKIQFDNKSVPLYSDMLPQKIKEMSFDDFFNTVLKKFQYKNNANT